MTLSSNPVIELAENGIRFLQAGNFIEAIKNLEQAVKSQPNNADWYNHLGISHLHNGSKNNAHLAFQTALKQDPTSTDAMNNLGNLLMTEGKIEAAIRYYQEAIRLKPDFSLAYNNLGRAFQKIHRWTEAISYIKKAISLDPQNVLALNNLSILLKSSGNSSEAQGVLDKILAIHPQDPIANTQLADIFRLEGKHELAKNMLEKVITQHNAPRDAYFLLGQIYKRQKNYHQAIETFKKALIINPDSLLTLGHIAECQLAMAEWDACQTTRLELEKTLINNPLAEPLNPFHGIMLFVDPDLQQTIARRWCQRIQDKVQAYRSWNKPNPDKLRIGYISADFSSHPIGILLNKLFEHHDRKQFEVIAFPTRVHHDNYYKNITEACDKTVILQGLSFADAAQTIKHEDIDILIDLSGHGDNHCLDILAYQPAAAQCHYLGYPATLGAEFIPYMLTHPAAIPEEDHSFTETLVYLPHSLIANSGFAIPKSSLSKQALGLPEDRFIFCCHSQAYRIDQQVFNCWMKILTQVPASILWLTKHSDSFVENIKKSAIAHHIDIDRLIFTEPYLLSEDWLHMHADLWLDTFTLTAGTASMLCAWAGLPLLTLNGNSSQSRTAAVYLSSLGLIELICQTAAEYTERAIEIANKPEYLKSIKEKLSYQTQSSALFKPRELVQKLEAAYQEIWQHYITHHSKVIIEAG